MADIEAQNDIEKLLCMAYSDHSGEDEYEDILARWRKARGEAAFDKWTWWWKDGDDADLEGYQGDGVTREEALADAKRNLPDTQTIELIEAACWADSVGEGEEIMPFARTRNHEVVKVGA